MKATAISASRKYTKPMLVLTKTLRLLVVEPLEEEEAMVVVVVEVVEAALNSKETSKIVASKVTWNAAVGLKMRIQA